MVEINGMTPDRLKKIVEKVIARYLPDWGLTLPAMPIREPNRDPAIWHVSLQECSRTISVQLLIAPGHPEEIVRKEIYEQLKAGLRGAENKAKGSHWNRDSK